MDETQTTKESVLRPGDVVRLKSGGPNMTVNIAHAADDDIQCVWYNSDGTYHTHCFSEACLAPVPGTKPATKPKRR